jgi:hypothetical protein
MLKLTAATSVAPGTARGPGKKKNIVTIIVIKCFVLKRIPAFSNQIPAFFKRILDFANQFPAFSDQVAAFSNRIPALSEHIPAFLSKFSHFLNLRLVRRTSAVSMQISAVKTRLFKENPPVLTK